MPKKAAPRRRAAVKPRKKPDSKLPKTDGKLPEVAAPPPKRGDDLLSNAETARLLGLNSNSLERLRMKGNGAGPPYTKDSSGRIWYKRSDVTAYVAPAQESTRFNTLAPSHLPEPEPIRKGKLSKRNLAICEAMARTGNDLELILDRLGASRTAIDTDVLERLMKSIAMWRADSIYLTRRAVISNAITSKQIADRQMAEKILTDTNDIVGWAEIGESTRDRIMALIEKARRIEKLKREGKH
jgi:hypothetical protein